MSVEKHLEEHETKCEWDLLKGDEGICHLVCLLNSEIYSPLKNRIMIDSKNITNGYQESQISQILDKSGAYRQLEMLSGDDYDKMTRIITNYMVAWELVYGLSFKEPGEETLTKIGGLRYILYLFPTAGDILLQRQKGAYVAEFKSIIETLFKALEVEDVFTDPSASYAFSGEDATISLAKQHSAKLKAYEQKHKTSFNVAEGL